MLRGKLDKNDTAVVRKRKGRIDDAPLQSPGDVALALEAISSAAVAAAEASAPAAARTRLCGFRFVDGELTSTHIRSRSRR